MADLIGNKPVTLGPQLSGDVAPVTSDGGPTVLLAASHQRAADPNRHNAEALRRESDSFSLNLQANLRQPTLARRVSQSNGGARRSAAPLQQEMSGWQSFCESVKAFFRKYCCFFPWFARSRVSSFDADPRTPSEPAIADANVASESLSQGGAVHQHPNSNNDVGAENTTRERAGSGAASNGSDESNSSGSRHGASQSSSSLTSNSNDIFEVIDTAGLNPDDAIDMKIDILVQRGKVAAQRDAPRLPVTRDTAAPTESSPSEEIDTNLADNLKQMASSQATTPGDNNFLAWAADSNNLTRDRDDGFPRRPETEESDADSTDDDSEEFDSESQRSRTISYARAEIEADQAEAEDDGAAMLEIEHDAKNQQATNEHRANGAPVPPAPAPSIGGPQLEEASAVDPMVIAHAAQPQSGPQPQPSAKAAALLGVEADAINADKVSQPAPLPQPVVALEETKAAVVETSYETLKSTESLRKDIELLKNHPGSAEIVLSLKTLNKALIENEIGAQSEIALLLEDYRFKLNPTRQVVDIIEPAEKEETGNKKGFMAGMKKRGLKMAMSLAKPKAEKAKTKAGKKSKTKAGTETKPTSEKDTKKAEDKVIISMNIANRAGSNKLGGFWLNGPEEITDATQKALGWINADIEEFGGNLLVSLNAFSMNEGDSISAVVLEDGLLLHKTPGKQK